MYTLGNVARIDSPCKTVEPTQRINPSIPAVYVCMHSFRTQKKKKKKKKKMKARDVGAPVTWLCLGIRICSYTMYLVFFTFVNLDLWFFATLGSADFCWTKLSHPNFKKKLIFMPFGRDWDIWRRIMWLWDQEDQAFVGPFIAQPYKLQNERWVRYKLCSEGLLWAIPSMDCSPKISPLI